MVWHWTCEWKAGDTSLLSEQWWMWVGRHGNIYLLIVTILCTGHVLLLLLLSAVRRCFLFEMFRFYDFGPDDQRIVDLIYCDYCQCRGQQ